MFVGPDGRLTAGGPTEQLAEAFPDRIVHDPRHLLVTRESARIADREIPTTALAAALLRHVMPDAAGRRVVLTYPARWGAQQVRALGAAASEAGLPEPWFLTEAEAAAAFHDPRPGTTVAVYDLGGRSLDITIVRSTEQGTEIVGRPGGHDRFGGADLDQALLGIVAERAARLDAAAWAESQRRPHLVRHEVIEAKHRLSDQDRTSLRLDGLPEAITVTRAEFEDATDQMLRWSVGELVAVIERAGLSPADLAAVHLAGGATRMPRIAELITERLGRPPTTTPDPKAMFTTGALRAYAHTTRPVAAAPAPARRTRVPPMALAVIPVAAAVIAGSFFVRSQLGPSENTGSSSSITTPPAAPVVSPAPSLPTPLDSPADTPTPTEPEISPTPEDEPGIREGTYSVSLSGTVGGRTFQRSAELQVKSTVARVGTNNGVNPIEVCLRSGFPAGTPEVGAIWFGTNTACFPERGAQLDTTTVEVSGDTVTVRPDARIAAAGLNQFTASGDYIYACLYQPVSGTMTVTFSGGSASGELDINGYSGPCQAAGTNTTYTATFTN
ncbi:Hsp70 family protein [Actinomadura bangladeshensis]